MEADFWHRRWQKNEIGFHEEDGNHLLKAYFEELKLPVGARIFVPLCGKTRDIAWLLSKGYKVVGIELNQSAITQLFTELGLNAAQVNKGDVMKSGLTHFHQTFSNDLSLDIYQGDFFALDTTLLGNVDAVFDRGALVALPQQMRRQYAQHLQSIIGTCKQLLVCYQYEKGLLQGPPHSVDAEEVNTHYQTNYLIESLHYDKVKGGFREQAEVFESAYLLTPVTTHNLMEPAII